MKISALPVLQSYEPAAEAQDGWKPSIYNHFVERSDVVWGINFFSLALLRLSPDQYRKVRQVLDNCTVPQESEALEELRRSLIRGKFIVPNKLDEIDFLKAKNRASRFGNHALSLVIAPTLRCNFGCEYCYVDLNANKMKPEIRDRVARFFEKKLPENTSAEVVWTGGDPSLAMDVVEELSLRFLKACERKGCSYKAHLITNAYLLDERMREHLRNSKVSLIQVSIDGSREFHDAIRCLPNKKPTYDTILRNVAESCDEFDIILRINVDRKNFEKLPSLLEDLQERNLTHRVRTYFAHVDDVNENSAPYHASCLTAREYAEVESHLTRLALEKGFRIGNRTLPRKLVKTFCGANTTNFYVIDPAANLLKCYHDFGAADKHGIGNIGADGSEVVTNPYNLLKWLGWDPFDIKECRDCKVLPLCMGGCIHKIVNSGMNMEKGCLRLRFSMDDIVEVFGENLSKNRKEVLSGGCGCAASTMTNA